MGNIVNRVFDSSGPEGKVRGTPQQIIDKYQVLARDAQLSNDRVAAENFLQHSEHYTRMLSEAQREAREAEARREPQQGGQGRAKGQDEQGGGQADAQGEDGDRGSDAPQSQQPQPEQQSQPAQPPQDGGGAVIDLDGKDGDGSGLVETPEATASDPQEDNSSQGQDDKPTGGGAARKTTRAPARRRSPAKSAKSDNGNSGDGGSGDSTANSAAE